MKKIFLAFVDFVKKPDDTQHPDQRVQSKWRVFFVLFFFEFLLLSVYLPLFTLLESYVQLEEAFDMTFSAVATFFIMVLIVPLIEEFVFRLILRRNALTKPFFLKGVGISFFRIWFIRRLSCSACCISPISPTTVGCFMY